MLIVEGLKVVFEDDDAQETLLYSGQTTLAPLPQLCTSWLLSGTPIKFQPMTAGNYLSNLLGVTEMFQTITTVGVYSGKSIEELRLEDYNIKRPQYSSCSYSFGNSGVLFGHNKAKSLKFNLSEQRGINPIPSYSQEKQFVRWIVSTASSGEQPKASVPESPSFSFTPSINFISESDPAVVFSPPQTSAAGKEPLSTLSVSEGQQIKDALLESIVKCMQIQNSLHRLVLLKLQVHVTAAAGQTDTDPQCSGASLVAKDPSKEGSRDSLSDTRALLCELKEPLEGLMRCADIQRSLFQRLMAVNLITTKEEADQTVASLPSLHDNQEVQSNAQVNMLAVQYDLEEIAFNTKMDCGYVRNPFSSQLLKVSSSVDVIHHTSLKVRDNLAVGAGKRVLPNGRGSLKTVTGKLVYSGEWRKGKRHGKGEGLIVSLPGVGHSTAHSGYYTGGWKHNMRHGRGKMMFSSGAVYDGQWQFDKMTGYGTLKHADGSIQKGTWKEGSLNGCVLFTWPHGATEYREYDASRGQLSSCKIEKEAVENLSQTSSTRYELMNLRECVTELKDEKRFLAEELNTQKIEHAEVTSELTATLNSMQTSFITQRKKDLRNQQEECDRKVKDAELKNAERIRELEQELEQSLNAQLCQICFERPRDCIIMPCTHLLYCRTCVTEHKRKGDSRCPTCRGPISGEILCNVNHS